MRAPKLRPLVRRGAAALAWLLAAAVISAPIAVEQALERVTFSDRLGTVPVEVTLCSNGYSSLDTGILGTVFWDRTGPFGLGACLRVTEPPEAGGTLASYADAEFVRTNAQLISEPDQIARAYGDKVSAEFWAGFIRIELLLVALILAISLTFRPRRWSTDADTMPWWNRALDRHLLRFPLARRVVVPTALTVAATAATAFFAWSAYDTWAEQDRVGTTYPLADVPGLSFSSPQTREIAAQVQPFITKNQERLQKRGDQFRTAALDSFRSALMTRADLAPRAGEKVVLAEADPQGSEIATRTRTALYPELLAVLGPDAVALRTISGDITSNGTIAEDGFVEAEGAALSSVPVVAVKGDHDSDDTVDQLREHGFVNPDLRVTDVGEFRVAGANDPEFKTLFGGSVTNPTGVTEKETGERLRAEVPSDEAVIVLLHQPETAAAYLGIKSLDALGDLPESLTEPYDDGIPDVPPGVLSIGHLHTYDGPRVIWNTDTETTTWTVVDQLGTSGGVENQPTFNRFSTPFSVPLKPVGIRLHYLDTETGLVRGYATIVVDTAGNASISERADIGAQAATVRPAP